MSAPITIRVAANLERNLDDICRFLDDSSEGAEAFARLIEELFDVVIPNLDRFPAMGRDLLARQPASAQGRAKVERIRERMGSDVELREYIFGDYLMLYALRGSELWLLSVRHHRQLSFDLRGRWL